MKCAAYLINGWQKVERCPACLQNTVEFNIEVKDLETYSFCRHLADADIIFVR